MRKEFYWNSANRNALEWMNEIVFVPITSVITRMVGDRENRKVAYINVQVRDVKDMEKATAEVKAILKRGHGGVEDFQVFNRAAFMQQMDEQGQDLRHHLPRLRRHLAPRGRHRHHEHPAGLVQRTHS